MSSKVSRPRLESIGRKLPLVRQRLQNLDLAVSVTALALCAVPAHGAVVFNDNFTRANSSTVGNNWIESNPGGGDVAISSNRIDILSNQGNDSGASFITQATSNFAAGWNNVLTNGTGAVTWSANMQSNNGDMGGFNAGEEATAFVLAANGSDLNTANGYAIVWGDSDATDSIRLVRFTGGLDADANLTDLLVAGSGVPQDPDTNFMSVKVTYDPVSDTWALFARSDGAAFVDPTTGSYSSYGTVVNTTFTSAAMTNIGLLGRYDKNNDSRLFDNVTVEVAVPEPVSGATLSALGAGALLRRRRR